MEMSSTKMEVLVGIIMSKFIVPMVPHCLVASQRAHSLATNVSYKPKLVVPLLKPTMVVWRILFLVRFWFLHCLLVNV